MSDLFLEWDLGAANDDADVDDEVERDADETHIRRLSRTPSEIRRSTDPSDVTGGDGYIQKE